MADIELVIKIPEELLEYFASHNCMSEDGWFSYSSKLLDAFRNGIPLPKGHGMLIDADSMWNAYHDLDYDFYEALDFVDTIIEADKTEGGGKECTKKISTH